MQLENLTQAHYAADVHSHRRKDRQTHGKAAQVDRYASFAYRRANV